MPILDEQLREEAERKEEFDVLQQQKRMELQQMRQWEEEQEEHQQSTARQLGKASNAASKAEGVNKAVKYAKFFRKAGIVVGALTGSFPIWGTIALGVFIVIILISGCNTGIVGALNEIGLIPKEVCGGFESSGNFNSGGGGSEEPTTPGPIGDFAKLPTNYYLARNFWPNINGDYAEVKPSVLPLVDKVFDLARAENLLIRVTSARRTQPPYHFSCHVLGQAVDFVLESTATPANIDRLVAIGRQAGFKFIQDEYRRPSSNATAPHIHMGLTSSPNCTP